ncbi:hypothetical protein CQA62_05735 [Helicobacter cholecystus]|uniref:Uncharacterized protein n=1 Tax=Helicobacter cholecystus TaxID=45498 RepID=A0A3D8IUN9_9HELI|nr:hypothetical protein [Helicobacter cholecystus]RDU68720.1 hypothetical protein CQA62_05735 [Helicobacter cholecystus]VEJ26197.1 ATP synthase F0F1 subunit B [Helicobacter cholecystus]
MSKVLLLVGILSIGLFGSEVSFTQSDFIERLINFIIFFLILWYFGSSRIKQIFINRRERISEEFNRTQEEEQHVKREREKIKKSLEDAKNKAAEIIALAKKDSYLISQKYEEKLDKDIKMVVAANEEKLQQVERSIIQEEVKRSLDCICKDLKHDDEYYARVIAKGIEL